MSWLKVDDHFIRHPKVMELSDKAFRLHVGALCHCAEMLTDGRVTERDVRMLLPVINANTWKKYVNELIMAGLWTVETHGWNINDYLDYNPSSQRVKAQRDRHANQQREYRRAQARAQARVGPTDDAPSRPVYENPPSTRESEAEPRTPIDLLARINAQRGGANG